MTLLPRRTASINVSIPDLGMKIRAWKLLAPKAFDRGMEAGIRAATIDITAHTKNLLSGPVLNRRTHRLWKSIHPEVFRKRGRVIGIVGTDVKYAAIHEFGGTIRAKKEGNFLMFTVGGDVVRVREVEIPARPFMSRAFEERSDRVTTLVQRHVMKAVKGVLESRTSLPPSQRIGVGFNAN